MADVTLKWNNSSIISFEYGVAIGISKDFVRSDDGTVLSEKHNITIKGSVVASGTNAEARYISLFNKSYDANAKVLQGGEREYSLQIGKLEVTGTEINYSAATLLSINVPEASEDTAGIQFQEVSLVFESIQPPTFAATYKLKSANENWDFKKEEDKITYKDSDISLENDNVKYSLTVTHTVSAQGLYEYGISKKEALKIAYEYVSSRLKNDIKNEKISQDLQARTFLNGLTFTPSTSYFSGGAYDIISSDASGFKSYNKIRSSSTDINTATYSVTTVYFMSDEPATIDASANFSRDESGESSVSVEGTIQGLSGKDVNSLSNDKLTNARTVYGQLSGNGSLRNGCHIFSLANNVFNNYHPDKTGIAIRDYPIAVSVGENKTNGSILFNVTYKIIPSEYKAILDNISGAIAANISVNDSNRNVSADYDVKTIVEIAIVGRQRKGPILQDMSTTKQRTRSVSIDVTVDATQRTKENYSLKSNILTQANSYKPSGSKCYVQDFSESWDWVRGQYRANFNWIYQI